MASVTQRERSQHDQQPVADVPEHHPEHQAVRDHDEWRRIDVLVGNGAVGGHERPERVRRRRRGEQRRRLLAARTAKLDQRRSELIQARLEPRERRPRRPAHEHQKTSVPDGAGPPPIELDLTGQQIPGPATLELPDIRSLAGQRGAAAGPPAMVRLQPP